MGRILLERPHGAGGRDADAVDHFHAFDDAAEHRVAPARGQGIEIGVVGDVDVELRIAGVRAGARARPTVPRRFLRPLPASFGMGFNVGLAL